MVNCEQSSNLFWAPGSSSRSTASPFRFVILAPSRLTTTATTPSLSVSRGCNANCSGGRILSAYYARFTQDNAHYLSVGGNERRDSFDVRIYAKTNGFDGDLEVMGQTESIGNDDIGAWAVGSLAIIAAIALAGLATQPATAKAAPTLSLTTPRRSRCRDPWGFAFLRSKRCY